MVKTTVITIDSKDYDLDALSDEVKAQLMSLQITDAQISNLNARLVIAKTARNAYATALSSALSASLLAGISEGGSIRI